VPNDVAEVPLFICFYLNKAENIGDYIKISNVQLELGATATSYTPFVADIEAVKVRAQGKNLLDKNKMTVSGGELTFDGNKLTVVNTKSTPDLKVTLGNYKYFVGKKITVSYTLVDFKSESGRKNFNTYIQTDKGVVISQKSNYNSDGKFEMTAVIPEDATATSLKIRQYVGYMINTIGDYITISDLQVEFDEVTEYEPYIEPIEYGQGEVIKSIYPSTTLTTDTAGALIEVEYNRDINKAFAELQQAIISLGGNV
jgi:hypothetical protein